MRLLSLTEAPRLPKASEDSLRPQGLSRGSGGLLSAPRLLKASEGSQGFLRPQIGPGVPERTRGELEHGVCYTRCLDPTTSVGTKGWGTKGKQGVCYTRF